MSIVDAKKNDAKYIISLSGRIDSTNATEVEEKINEACENKTDSISSIDAENLEYISSAGLRIILRLRKNNPTLKIINASSEVYEIFDMTGFTDMMTIEKAYRKISVEGCEVIGQGANGKVYRIDRDTIVKVYMNPDSLDDIHNERELARKAFILGVPTAIPYDVVKVGKSYGSVFELLNAKSFAKLINAEPDKVDDIIDLYVDLAKKIHSTVVKPEDMPSMRDTALVWANFYKGRLSDEKADKLIRLVEEIPEDNHMLHGDYHIKNVMMQNGEVLLIDMDTLCHGHPIFELASMYNAYEGFSIIDKNNCEKFLGVPVEICKHIWKRSLALYLGTDDEQRLKEVENKAKLMGYTRLARRFLNRNADATEEGRKLVESYMNGINELLDEVDILIF